jgi:hypothetical protein
MRITEGQLRRIIREELEGSDDRAIVVLGSTFAGPVYVVAYDRRELERAIERERARNPIAPDPGDYFGVIAGLTLKRNDEYGECNGAWRVTTAASNERGWGTKVYLAAFEWLRNISSDRTSVSTSAETLWKSLARKGIVEPEPFDDRKNPQTPPTSDDCKVFPSRDPVLNSSFRLKGSIPSEVSQLLDDGSEHLSSFGSMRPDAEKLLRVGIGNLFVNLYDN